MYNISINWNLVICLINSNLPKRLSVMTVFFVRQAVIQIN